ncbi:uncharacterized protein LAESUDRAFT_701470 [Laetiporus sulphureus 93-53]|uniref:Uncharacterized protein n=1 Tax=Laetiporus sulphureus 93-53 TaxID=1314785 RepID=A0A165DZN8_9APHY|nr:uncharacterized protein LAESUDRAFT_701470 [Laetiporus sulphureus 93-53]KZT05968.1 hypothetical protein LAESUDRAFT_701470 [Laetiporus sulphureus 93-53]
MSTYPIQWLDTTFNSPSRAQELLRPDLESGLITPHDYQLATTFLPGSHRYWPHMYAAVGSGMTAGYVRYLRRPPMSLGRTTLLATVSGFFGAVYGQICRAEAHFAFSEMLDDPVAFSQALENVNKRMGGVRPLGWTLARAKEVKHGEGVHGNAPRPAEGQWAPDAEGAEMGVGSAAVPSRPVSLPEECTSSFNASAYVVNVAMTNASPSSRWDAIRTANARNAGQTSSWDALRQSHERARVPSNPDRPPEEPDRAREQAEFDALLEAERKLGSG